MNAQDRLRNRKAILTFLLPFWIALLPALVALGFTVFQGAKTFPQWIIYAAFIAGMVTGMIEAYIGFLLLARSGLIEEDQRALQRRAITPPDEYMRGERA